MKTIDRRAAVMEAVWTTVQIIAAVIVIALAVLGQL